MFKRLRQLIIPAYLLLCLLLGGSNQGIWRNMVLQLLAVVLIAAVALWPSKEPLTRASRLLLALAIAGLALFVLQLIPLPPEIWTAFPGRAFLTDGYAALGRDQPWLPVSLTPHATLSAWLSLLPPLAVLLAMVRLGVLADWSIGAAILIGAMFNVVLGAVQTAGGGWPDAWWYLYDFTNPGAVGFFANRNHMGTLLLASVPLATVLLARRSANGRGKHSWPVVGSSVLLLLLVGLALNQSLAAIVLVVPVVAASALLLPAQWQVKRWALPAIAGLGVLAIIGLTSSPVLSELEGSQTASIDTRGEIWGITAQVAQGSFPIGTGFGSFERVYRLNEGSSPVDRTYVNHAHNDYLEVTLESGAAGALLLLSFLLWWGTVTSRIWRSPVSSRLAKAATISSGAILAHSIVDYPLRTAAIAAVLAGCLSVMARANGRSDNPDRSRNTAAKHLVIG